MDCHLKCKDYLQYAKSREQIRAKRRFDYDYTLAKDLRNKTYYRKIINYRTGKLGKYM